jgi:hypothetical protein
MADEVDGMAMHNDNKRMIRFITVLNQYAGSLVWNFAIHVERVKQGKPSIVSR